MRILIGMLAIILVGCCRQLMPPSTTNTRDSVRVEVKETIRLDTVEIPIPIERVEVMVPKDTVSTLKTSLAISVAGIRDGFLWHSLENRQDNNPSVTIPVKDTDEKHIEYREVEKNVPYPVEIPLSWWQRFRMNVGGYAIGALFGIIGWWLLKKFVFR